MGKVVFNIVETDYDVSKAEETYLKFRRDYELLKYIREELKKERKELKIKELRKRYKLEGVLE